MLSASVVTALLLCQSISPRLEPIESAKVVFYVSSTGNDNWSGRRPAADLQDVEGPFATLSAARDAIRRLRREQRMTSAVDVMLLEGTYHFTEPLVLTSEDSGSEQTPVTWTVYPGHRAIISGGQIVDGWQPYRDKILQAQLPKAIESPVKVRQLFFRGKRQNRACWPNPRVSGPNGHWAFFESEASNTPSPFTNRFSAEVERQKWAHPEQAEINVFPWYCWVNDLIPVKSVDNSANTITMTRAPHFSMPIIAGNRFRVENMLEELDEPGEWCVRHDSRTLYFWPSDELPSVEVTIPVIDTLFELRGTPESPVHHLTISGLTFAQTSTPYPDDAHDNFHSPAKRGAGVLLEHCHGCRVERNRFDSLGGDSIRLQGDNSQNEIVGNEIANGGASGIVLVSLDKAGNAGDTPDFENQHTLREHSKRFPKMERNRITDNHIFRCGYFKKNCGGVHMYAINSVDNLIAHNHIHDMPDKGMVMQDGFGRYIVEFNEMHDLGHEIADTGGIMVNRWFVLEDDPHLRNGAIIRFNRIRNCYGCGAYSEQRHPKGEGDRMSANGRVWSPYYTWGIYFDNSGMNNTVFGNIVAATVLGGVSLPVGNPRNNRVENNILIGSSANQLDLRLSGANNRFVRNILYCTNSKAMVLAAGKASRQAISECDYNLYFHVSDKDPSVRGIGLLSDWQKLGFDEHSFVADPLLVDVNNEDFRLRPDSPAFKLGFQPIPVEKIGPRLFVH